MDNSDFQHYNRSERYVREIKKIYQALIKEVSGLMALGKIDLEKPFSFSDYPHLAKQFDKIFRFYAENITLKIESYKGKEWRYGEVKVYQSAGVEVPKIKIPPVRPPKELSERVWKHLSQYKGELELGLDLSIGRGKSANEIARDLKQYLNEPDRLFRRVRDKHGNLHLSKNAQNYHPGQGVYRSSFKNAQRLARTETNRAYHEASWRKYQEWDFVVGYEVRLSNNPKHCSFCSAMAGKYPKEFKFFGWHPNCRCTTIPILAKDIDDILESEKITELPKPMRDWLNDNADKIEKAKNKPWFVVDNREFLGRGKRYLENQKAYYSLLKDKDYIDVKFNILNGGLKATHRLHNFHPKMGHYEEEVRDILFNTGNKIILAKERADVGEIIKDGQKHIDGYLNDLSCDISTILGSGKNTIKKAFQHSHKKGAEMAILYFPDKEMFSIEKISLGLKMFNSHTDYEFKQILSIVDNKIIYHK